jgi:hypothetical protein
MQTTPPAADDDDVIAMLERLDAGLPPSSPEEAAARAPYERLIRGSGTWRTSSRRRGGRSERWRGGGRERT